MKKCILTITMIIFTGFLAYSQNHPTTVKCKNKTIERVRKHCVCKDIEQYAKNNYDVRSVSSHAQSRLNRIYTRFNISNDGQIKNIQVKGFSPELEKEAIRVIASFPDIIPATELSKTVVDSQEYYTILIQFEVKNTITNL